MPTRTPQDNAAWLPGPCDARRVVVCTGPRSAFFAREREQQQKPYQAVTTASSSSSASADDDPMRQRLADALQQAYDYDLYLTASGGVDIYGEEAEELELLQELGQGQHGDEDPAAADTGDAAAAAIADDLEFLEGLRGEGQQSDEDPAIDSAAEAAAAAAIADDLEFLEGLRGGEQQGGEQQGGEQQGDAAAAAVAAGVADAAAGAWGAALRSGELFMLAADETLREPEGGLTEEERRAWEEAREYWERDLPEDEYLEVRLPFSDHVGKRIGTLIKSGWGGPGA